MKEYRSKDFYAFFGTVKELREATP